MTVPIDPITQLAPAPEDAPTANHRTPGLPSERSLERFQRYLSPLQRLGAQRSAWIGAALLFIGVFLPAKAATIPFLNVTISASFWDFSKFESLILILLALASGWLAWVHDYKWLWVTGAISLVFLVIEFFDALTASYVHPSWGWLVLFPGVVLILAAAALKRDPRETPGDATTVIRDLVRRMSEGHS